MVLLPHYIPLGSSQTVCEENDESTLGGWKTETQLALVPGWDKFWTQLEAVVLSPLMT